MVSPLPDRPKPLTRFVPLALVIVAVLAVAVRASVKGSPADEETASAAVGSGGPEGTDPTDNPDLPTYFRVADEAGELGDYDWGEKCDLITGRVTVPTIYAPPCVPVHEGANGGATSPGVTADEIKVVVYQAAPGNDIAAALSGVLDDEDVQQRTREAYIEMFNDRFETYGRTVSLQVVIGSGASDDEAAAVADAIKIAEEIQPFAVINGPSLTDAFADTLADRQILCFNCGLAVPDSTYQRNAPYMWGLLPTPEQFLRNFGDFTVRRMFQRKAEFAGPELRDEERVFGTINFEQDPPVFSAVGDEVRARGKQRGYEAAVTETYLLDIPKLPERAASIIARMKAAGVTTIIFLGDPITPTYLTEAATAEDYYPEWVIAGTVLTDTTALGRRYDPAQWEHAFGLSNLAGRQPRKDQGQWRLYEWYYGEEPEAQLTSGVIFPTVQLMMIGIHMAGPNLTPETFQGGMFSYPPTGGGPTTPQISFGNHGYFEDPDYLATDDATEIWWDAEATGPDEQDKSDAPGMWRYGNGGERFLPGRMQSGPPVAHDPATSPALFTETPPEDQYPEYPSPAGGG
ncbi:hypothetical protein BH24ACT4_BH24ACT4_23040 [soil metagenome]